MGEDLGGPSWYLRVNIKGAGIHNKQQVDNKVDKIPQHRNWGYVTLQKAYFLDINFGLLAPQ